jgi:large subunit ribosomal protein L3
MSEAKESKKSAGTVQLNGLLAFKVGMSTVFDDNGEAVPVTVLKYEPLVVSQVKSKEKDGYEAVQVACSPKRASRSPKGKAGHLKKAGFEHSARFVREFRQAAPEGAEVGARIDIGSVKKGDIVKITGTSRGRGFSGVVRRWSFGGGPATHGSGFHRKPGSVGNRTEPGRVIAGKKMAGHWGNETVTTRNLLVVDVMADENVILVKGAVPGHRNSLVQLTKTKV